MQRQYQIILAWFTTFRIKKAKDKDYCTDKDEQMHQPTTFKTI
jgi:hypothetical protein